MTTISDSKEESAISQNDFNKLRLACVPEKTKSIVPSGNTAQKFNYVCKGGLSRSKSSTRNLGYTEQQEENIRKSLAKLLELQEAERKSRTLVPTVTSIGGFLPQISLGISRSQTLPSLNSDIDIDRSNIVNEPGDNNKPSTLLHLLRNWSKRPVKANASLDISKDQSI